VDCKTGINSSTIDLFSLNIEPPYRRTHSLGTHSNDTNVLWKIKSHGLQMPKKKSMGKPKNAVWLHVRENFLIVISLLHEIKL